jgi:hypothetical protein
LSCVLAVFSFLVVIAGTANQAAAEKLEGAALEEHVISHSPWSGDWITPPYYKGRVTYVFERLEGKFSARITETTNGATAAMAVGPVSGLLVAKDTIHLTSAAGTRHEFKVNEKGELVGKGTTSGGLSVSTVLKPAAKEKK